MAGDERGAADETHEEQHDQDPSHGNERQSPTPQRVTRAIVSMRSAIPCGGAGHTGRGETGRLELRWPIRRNDAGVETRIWL